MPDASPPKPAAPPCPICGKPVPAEGTARVRPFCSARCADVDLGRWFGGAYAISGLLPDLDEDPPDSSAGHPDDHYRG